MGEGREMYQTPGSYANSNWHLFRRQGWWLPIEGQCNWRGSRRSLTLWGGQGGVPEAPCAPGLEQGALPWEDTHWQALDFKEKAALHIEGDFTVFSNNCFYIYRICKAYIAPFFSARSIRKSDHTLDNSRERLGQEEEFARPPLEGHHVDAA